MATKLSYLVISPTGWYEYRRRVPARLRPYFPLTSTGKPMSEWKKALETKNERVAQVNWLKENQEFETALSVAEMLIDKRDLLPHEAVMVGKGMTLKEQIHPSQAPTLTPSASNEEIQAFPALVIEWNNRLEDKRTILLDVLQDKYIDQNRMKKDYDEGRFFKKDYKTPYKQEDPNDPLITALKIIDGEVETRPFATWQDAMELYIRINKREKTREAVKELEWEKDTRSLLSKFAKGNGGMNIRLDDLDRQAIRNWLWATFPKAGTRNRYNNVFSSVINNWNRETKAQVFNPFAGLSNKQQEKEEAIGRRSFKPEEWHSYLQHVQEHDDLELRIIGLLMMFTGCRTSEAAGLQVRDVKLSGNIPHVVYRTNDIRRMDKDGLERAVPLLTPVLDAFRNYDLPTEPNKPIFRKYGSTRGFENASASLRNIVKNLMDINDPTVVPYSARHTFRDRSEVASGVPTARAEYIMGHVSEASSRIHKGYGTKTPPTELLDDLIKIFEVKDWGYYED